MSRWTHKARGGVYEIVSDSAHIQCSTVPGFEQMFGNDRWTVYRNVETGAVYIRLTNEFLDGRFERISE